MKRERHLDCMLEQTAKGETVVRIGAYDRVELGFLDVAYCLTTIHAREEDLNEAWAFVQRLSRLLYELEVADVQP